MNKTENELSVSDLELSVDYYSTILGIKGTGSKFSDEKNNFSLQLKQAEHINEINPNKHFPAIWGKVSTVEELYSLYLRCRENGALFAYNPRDTYENGNRVKEFAIRDIDGYLIAFKSITPIEDFVIEERPLAY